MARWILVALLLGAGCGSVTGKSPAGGSTAAEGQRAGSSTVAGEFRAGLQNDGSVAFERVAR